MIGNRRFLTVIPARGGSVGVPRKNIKPLGGRPLLAYTADQVAAVSEIDHAVVSTDDSEIAAVARTLGLAVVDRPVELASSTASSESAMLHALDVCERTHGAFDFIMLLEPTSPFRTPATIRRCMEAIACSTAPSLVSVVETRASLGRIVDGRLRLLFPDAPRRRQEREPLYAESSTVYVCSVDHLRRTGSLIAADWQAVAVPENEALDINTPHDFALAEALMAMKREH